MEQQQELGKMELRLIGEQWQGHSDPEGLNVTADFGPKTCGRQDPSTGVGEDLLVGRVYKSQAIHGAGDKRLGSFAGSWLSSLRVGVSRVEWNLFLLPLLIACFPSTGQAGCSWSAWLPWTPGSQGDVMLHSCPSFSLACLGFQEAEQWGTLDRI